MDAAQTLTAIGSVLASFDLSCQVLIGGGQPILFLLRPAWVGDLRSVTQSRQSSQANVNANSRRNGNLLWSGANVAYNLGLPLLAATLDANLQRIAFDLAFGFRAEGAETSEF